MKYGKNKSLGAWSSQKTFSFFSSPSGVLPKISKQNLRVCLENLYTITDVIRFHGSESVPSSGYNRKESLPRTPVPSLIKPVIMLVGGSL